MRLSIAPPIIALLISLGLILTGCALATKAPPVANAGPDIFAHVGETVSCDGSFSVDLDGGNIVYYRWSIAAAPEGREDQVGSILAEAADAMICTMDLPLRDENLGEWIIELEVTDDEGQSGTDDLKLSVVP
jgi:hypothetical protein